MTRRFVIVGQTATASPEFSLLDVPRAEPVDDPEAYLRAAIAWHFGQETGSAFWLRAARDLHFDPVAEVRTFADLRLFPNLLSQLRTEPVEDLEGEVRGFVAAGWWIARSLGGLKA